jgi:hypothetical protein
MLCCRSTNFCQERIATDSFARQPARTRRFMITAVDRKWFRHGVLADLPEVCASQDNEKQPPGRLLLECLNGRRGDVVRFLTATSET